MKVREYTIAELNGFAIMNRETGCLEWKYSVIDGYGQIENNGKRIAAHRYSYILHNGEISKEMEVCHTCDNRKCIAIEHLFLGTHQDNMDDMKLKGRSPVNKGARNGNVKLTDAQVLHIRKIKADMNLPYKDIASIFNVSPEMISYICRRKYRNDI